MPSPVALCPNGCGRTIVVDPLNRLACVDGSCPSPSALHNIVNAPNPEAHVVELGEDGFSIVHPLIERVGLALLHDCPLQDYLLGMDGPPVEPGRYLARLSLEGMWEWEVVQ